MSLLDADRRILGQLGQPRNVQHLTHELRSDEGVVGNGAPPPSEEVVYDRLQAYVEQELVVKLGEHTSGGAAVKRLPAKAFDFHDEAAQLFEDRLRHPRQRWRLDGDLFILAKKGVDALREPSGGESAAMSFESVQKLVDLEWARTLKDVDPLNTRGVNLSDALLPDEFARWFKDVAADCKKRWGKAPRGPLAGGAGWGNAYENSLLDAENQKTALGAVVDPWYMALTILAFTDTDTGTTADDGSHVPTYTGWARKSVAGSDMNAASSGSAANANAIVYAGCTAGASTILGFGNCSTSTGGVLRKYGTCSSTVISTSQTPAQFAAGAYITTAD